jgi:serine/threonine protein kinase
MTRRTMERFGNYLLLNRIAHGGMAEVFLARPANRSANGRVVVIKRILSHASGDPDFIRMFHTETQICMGFTHPNTVQIYDFGEVNGHPFIAMEYIEGRTLRQITSHLKKNNEVLPVECSAHLVMQAAAGLHYAHVFENRATGEKLQLIHRDVSPQNILLSSAGIAKVIDFGIAKSSSSHTTDHTRSGVIKGKASYLSPEQTWGKTLDGRSDIFSLGAVLWELLTGHKLFHAPNDFLIVEMIRNCEKVVKPPSYVNPSVPPALDVICLQALAAKPENRYQTAADFQRALKGFLLSHYPLYETSDVAERFHALLGDELDEDRLKLKELNDEAQSSLSGDIPAPAPTPPPLTALVATPPPLPPTAPTTGTSIKFGRAKEVTSQTALSKHFAMPKVTQGRVAAVLFWMMTVLAIKADERYFLLERFTMSTHYVRMASQTRPTPGQAVAAEAARPAESAPAASAPEELMLLKVNLFPAGSAVPGTVLRVNNVTVDPARGLVRVHMDRPVLIQVERPGFAPYRNKIVIDSERFGKLDMFQTHVTLERLPMGRATASRARGK